MTNAIRFPHCLMLALAALAGCADQVGGPEPPAPLAGKGELRVSILLEGLLPSRMVGIVLDNVLPVPVIGPGLPDPGLALATARVPAGDHTVAVTDLESNCQAAGLVSVYVPAGGLAGATLRVRCEAEPSLVGTGLAWLQEDLSGWGNSQLVLLKPGETARSILEGPSTLGDVAWSGQSNLLAVLDADGARILNPEDGRLQRTILAAASAIDWLPGREALGMLELPLEGCRIRIASAPWTQAPEMIPCGPGGTRGGTQWEDLAWSPDGQTAALTARRDRAIRLVDLDSWEVASRRPPDAGFEPIALAWTPDASELLVSGVCEQACTPDRLGLFGYDQRDDRWRTIATWEVPLPLDRPTLAWLGDGRIAIGPVGEAVYLVPLDNPMAWRPLLGGAKFRVTGRPGGRP